MAILNSSRADALWLKNPLAVLAPDSGGGIVIAGDKIIEQVASGARPSQPYARVFDASEHVVLPGLINTHHHFYQTLTRAFPPALNQPLFPWLQQLYPVWAGLTPPMFELANRVAMAELLLSGCTLAADHHYLYPPGMEEAVDIQVEAAQALGLRVLLTRGSMSLSTDDGGLPPPRVVQDEEVILADCERVIGRYHQAGEGARVQIALAPCSPFSVSRELMQGSADLARRHGVRLHTHLAETEGETDYCLRAFGARPLDYLESVGWLRDDVWLAHGIHFSDDEVRRLGQAGVGVAHCPGSNMLLASGICPVRDLEQAGVAVGLAVDGSASNDASNLIQEARLALLVQRLRYGASVSHLDALRWATQGAARCLGRDDVGSITVGRQADLALFRLDELRFSGHGDPLAALLLCGAQRADRVMVAGEWRVIDGAIPDLDCVALRHRHQSAARTLQA